MEPQVSLEAPAHRVPPHWLRHPQPHFWAQLHPGGHPANTGPVHSTTVGVRADRGDGGLSQKTRPAKHNIHRTTDPGRDPGLSKMATE